MDPRRIDYMPLEQVKPATRNPKRHDGPAINASITKFGMAETPLLDERTGRLVAGHGRIAQLEAMRDAGQDPPDGVQLDDVGSWLVPVTRGWASRSDAEADAYLLASNKLTANGGWDDGELGALLADLAGQDPDLIALAGFDADELEALLAEDDDDLPDGSGDPDDVPDAPAIPVSVLGDVWLLGKHRLMCGDSNEPGTLAALTAGAEVGIVYTDPPYGISIVSGSKVGGDAPFGSRGGRDDLAATGTVGGGKVVAATQYRPVAGDGSPEVAADAFRLLMTEYPSALHVWWGGNHFAGSAGLPDSSCWLVWDKDNTGNFADCELAWTNHPGAVRLLRHMWNGMLRASERGKRVHPTQKPVALAEWAFGVVDPKAERRVVLDVFGGSGSTLIAAHQTKRTALVCELEPHYVDVIARRFQEFTGIVPVLESTGEPHDFTGGD